MLSFEPIAPEEFPTYWKYSVESWIRDMQKAGFLKEDMGYREAEKEMRKFLPDGLSTAGHHIMHIVVNGKRVGTIWYEIREKAIREAYLWDIFLGEDERGKGYGKQAMTELQAMAEREGARRIQLNVFGYNTIAKNMYLKLGYREAAITMMKSI